MPNGRGDAESGGWPVVPVTGGSAGHPPCSRVGQLAAAREMSDQPGRVPHMGRKSLFDREALTVLLVKQNGVITRGQARDCGMSRQALEHRLRVGGPWQRMLPGVYLTNTGTTTGIERDQVGPGGRASARTAGYQGRRVLGEARRYVT